MPASDQQRTNSRLLIQATVVLFLIAAGFVWMQWEAGKFGSTVESVISNPEWAAQSSLSGTILLTLVPIGGGSVAAYDLDLATGDLVRNDVSDLLPIYRNLSATGDVLAISGALREDVGVLSNDLDMLARVFLAENVQGATVLPARELTSISPTPLRGARDIVVHDNGAVLFTHLSERNAASDNALINADAWGISYVRMGENPEVLVGGIQPQWVSDERFIFLRSDGVYVYDLQRQEVLHVVRTENALANNTHLAVSPDMRTIALSQPELSNVTFFKVDDWGSGEATPSEVIEAGTIAATAFWITFSPNSETLVLQAVDRAFLNSNPNPRLEWYDVNTAQKTTEDYSLTGFVQASMFMTDWIR